MTEPQQAPEPPQALGAEPPSSSTGPAESPTSPASPAPAAASSKHAQPGGDALRGSRASGFYASVAALGVVLILLIIFIAQNTQKATVNYLGWSGRVSVAVALLIAAAAGLFLALLASSIRIVQLRRRVKRERKAR